jgi:chorismate mutase/prephenate dehydratase
VDFEGNLAEARVHEAIQRLASATSFLKVLGSYPARTTKAAQPAEPRAGGQPPAPASESDESSEPAGPTPPHRDVLKELDKKPYKLASRATRPADSQFRIGSALIGGDKPVIIAGPCSVESREQVFACAKLVKELGGHILRGGCFKPRTSPYAFQGLGYEALDLLEEPGARTVCPSSPKSCTRLTSKRSPARRI